MKNYHGAYALFLSELKSQAEQQGMILELSAMNYVSDVFQRTCQDAGIPNDATVKETARRWVEHLQSYSQ